jgi:hypothetical protein
MGSRAPWKLALGTMLLHVALLALWPVVRAGYAPVFRALAQLAVHVVDPLPGPIEARFEPGAGGHLGAELVRMDTVVRLSHRGLEGTDATFGASSFFHGYLPTTVLLALLAVAAQGPWRARRKAGAWSLVLLHLFVAGRCVLAVYYAHAMSTIDGRPVLELGPASRRALHLVWHFGWEEMLANYMVPLLLFGLCVFGPRSSSAVEAADRDR